MLTSEVGAFYATPTEINMSVSLQRATLQSKEPPAILLGLDHSRLNYSHSGRDYRSTDVRGRVHQEMIA